MARADPSKRPILFSFNGGPGSSSVWLHMGALGPKMVLMTDDGNTLPPPYKYVDNPNTWLDKADIVFIDPMMTGFTRPAGRASQNEFTGYENDLRFVGDFIRLYITRYGRWSSPKFIAGESYGTTRAAGLSGYLQDRYNLNVNGIILISAILDFGTVRTDRGNDVPFPLGSCPLLLQHHGIIKNQIAVIRILLLCCRKCSSLHPLNMLLH